MRLGIWVALPGGAEVAAGEIESVGSPGREAVQFRYESSFIGNPDAYALSPELPLGFDRFTVSGTRTMFGGIADAQPDTWGRRLIESQRRRSAARAATRYSRASELDVLAAVPDETRHGAMRVKDGGGFGGTSPGAPTTRELPALMEAARAFENDEEVDEGFLSLFAAGTSMGGARPKATVRRNDGTLALAKLPREGDFGDAMAWEATALHLARNAGVTVPRFAHHRFGYHSVVIIDRFDRSREDRVGYLSADSLLIKQPGEMASYTDLANAMALVSSSPANDTRELFRRVAVTLLVNNFDDHMRNHGLIRAKTGWRLSPAFDINPFSRHGTGDSTPVSDADDPSDRDIRNLRAAADVFSLTATQAVEIIRKAERATSEWRQVASGFGIAPEGAEAMEAAFQSRNREEAARMIPPSAPSVHHIATTQLREKNGRFGSTVHSSPEVTLEAGA